MRHEPILGSDRITATMRWRERSRVALVPATGWNISLNLLSPRLAWRDVNSGDLAVSIALTRSGTVTGAILARAAASDTSDEMLVKRIAACD